MKRYCEYVAPNTFFPEDINGRGYAEGGAHYIANTQVAQNFSLGTVAPVDWGIYELIEDPDPLPANHFLQDTTYTFIGLEGSASARIEESRIYARISIDELLENRLEELESLAATFREQGFTATVADGGVRAFQSDIASGVYYAAQTLQGLPGTVFTNVDLWGEWVRVAKAEMTNPDGVWTGFALLYAQVVANTETHSDNMIALHAADDWEGLEAYDISTGWPDAPAESTTAGSRPPGRSRGQGILRRRRFRNA